MRSTSFAFLLFLTITSFGQRNVTLRCENSPEKFRVNFNHELLHPGSTALQIKIDPLNPAIESFEFYESDLGQYLLSNDNSKTWIFSIQQDEPPFKSTDTKFLTLIPVYRLDTPDSLQSCTEFKINIPIRKNKYPKKEMDREVPLTIGSDPYEYKIDGKELISDEFDRYGGKWFIDANPPELTIDPESGMIRFYYPGSPTRLQNQYSGTVTYRDWENLSASASIVFNVSEMPEPAILTPVDFSDVDFYEGIRKEYGRIFAYKGDNEISVKVIGYMNGSRPERTNTFQSEINTQGAFVWQSADYDIIEEEYKKDEKLVFIVKPEDTGSTETTLAIKLNNRTKPAAQNEIRSAQTIFNQANADFYESIKNPACIIARTITWLQRGSFDLGAFRNIYTKVEASTLGVPSNIVPFAEIGFGIAENMQADKRRQVEELIRKWQAALEDIIEEADELEEAIRNAKRLDFTSQYTTLTQAEALAIRTRDYRTAVRNLENNENLSVQTITSYLPRRRRGDVEEHCN